MLRPFAVLPAVLSMGLLLAQHSPLTGPLEGFVFDAPTQSFRSISGALGAASLGSVLLSGFDFGTVAPRQNYAIAYQGGQCLLVSGLDSAQPSSSIISDSCTLPEGIAWSGDGTVAVLYSRTGNWLQVVTGLPTQAVVNTPISVTPLGGSLSAVTSDLQGARLFIAVTGNSAGVYQVQSDQSLVPVLPVAQPLALAISDARQVLYALEGAGNQIYEMSLTDLSFQSWALTGLQNPVAIMPAGDAMRQPVLYVAGSSDQLLVAYDVANHAASASIPLDFSPLMVESLGAHSFVLRNRVSNTDPLWSFADTSEPPSVYFIPATPLTTAGGLQ